MDSEYRGYLLMHRDAPVARLTLDGATGSIVTVGELLNTATCPWECRYVAARSTELL